ncbi:hypothetical protein QTP88_019984 [Uroleucon formosanum]
MYHLTIVHYLLDEPTIFDSHVRGYIVRILFIFHSSSSNLSTQQSDLEAADCSIEANIDVGVNEFSDEESPVSLSLAIIVKKLPNKGINEVKIKSLALVTEIKEKYSAPEQPRITSVVPDQTNYYQLSSLQAVSDSVLYLT